MSGSSRRTVPVWLPKNRTPSPRTTGATSIATSSTSPAVNACPPTSPAHTQTSPSPASSLASATPASTESAVWNGASGNRASHTSGSGRWVTTTRSSPAAGTPAQPSVVSNRCRPITVALMFSQKGCTYSAEARLTLNGHLSLTWTVTSPLPYQSNSGPTVSSG